MSETTCNCPKNVVSYEWILQRKTSCTLLTLQVTSQTTLRKEYKGICATIWKEQFGNHKKVFRKEFYKTDVSTT